MPKNPEKLLEKDLYLPVERFAKRTLSCWETGQERFIADVGRLDVLGARYIGGDLSGKCEVIAIEVKPDTSRFALSAGQAHGYSVAADRCYLAVATPRFSAAQVMIAAHLNVGLISIKRTGRGYSVDEVVTAPAAEPIEEYRLQAAERLGLASCTLCRTLFPRDVDKAGDFKGVASARLPGSLTRAGEGEVGLMWWLTEQSTVHGRNIGEDDTRVRRYMCPACVYALAPGPPEETG